MARPIRIEFPGAAGHVIARDNPGERIFREDADRRCFLETPGEACQKTQWSFSLPRCLRGSKSC
jgi:hypothetical protein